MKSIFASLIVALLVVSATGKDQPGIVPLHREANPHRDTRLMKKDWRFIGGHEQ